MPRPQFTAEEQHLVALILDPSESSLMFEAAYLVPAAVLIVFGLVYSAPAAFASAFAIVATFRVWQTVRDRHSVRVLREVVHKYEQACADAPGAGDAL